MRSQEPDLRPRGLEAEKVMEVPLFSDGLHDRWDLGFCSAAPDHNRPQPLSLIGVSFPHRMKPEADRGGGAV